MRCIGLAFTYRRIAQASLRYTCVYPVPIFMLHTYASLSFSSYRPGRCIHPPTHSLTLRAARTPLVISLCNLTPDRPAIRHGNWTKG